MNIIINYRNMEKTEHLEAHAREELAKLVKAFDATYTPTDVTLTIGIEGHSENMHRAEILAHCSFGEFTLNEVNNDPYIAVNRVVHKLINELHQAKRERNENKNNPLRAEKEDWEK